MITDKRKTASIIGFAALLLICCASAAQASPETTETAAEDNGIWKETELPVSVEYMRLDESLVSAESEDPEIIGALIDAIRGLKVGEKNDLETLDQGDYLTFTFEDGSKAHIEFEGDNWVTEDKEKYYVEGISGLHSIFTEMYEPGVKARWREDENMTLKIGGTEVPVTWEDNESIEEIRSLLPLTIQMSMYGGFEQVGPIGRSIAKHDEKITTDHGDIVLYSGDQIVIFYGSNTWAYTRLGHVNLSQREMRDLLGNGDVTITISEGA